MNEHRLLLIKIRSAAYVAVIGVAFVVATSVRPCDDPEAHAAQKAQRIAQADKILGIERK